MANLEESVKEKYKNISNKIYKTTALGTVGLLVVTVGIGGYGLHQEMTNPYKKQSIVLQYNQATETKTHLTSLKRNLEFQQVPPLEITYTPEHFKPYIENLMNNKQKAIDSLDEALNILEKDIQNMEVNPIVDQYSKWAGNIPKYMGGFFVSSIVWLLGGITADIIYSKKRRRALAAIKTQTA